MLYIYEYVNYAISGPNIGLSPDRRKPPSEQEAVKLQIRSLGIELAKLKSKCNDSILNKLQIIVSEGTSY